MRRNLARAIAVLGVVLPFLMSAPAQVFFADENLEAEIRRQIPGKQDGSNALSEDDLLRITAIRVRDKQIRDLRGIERCESLMRLDLAGNQITDLSPLEALPALESLDLSGNRIDDVTPLARLRRLNYLDLSRNRITDLSPLANLSALKALDLSENQIADVKPLANLERLWSLDLSSNRIEDIHPLGRLDHLLSLDLDRNRIRDVSVLRRLSGLRTLSLENNQITDIRQLVESAGGDRAGTGPVRYWRISLRGNPLNEDSLKHLRTLEEYTWDVQFDEPALAGRAATPPSGG